MLFTTFQKSMLPRLWNTLSVLVLAFGPSPVPTFGVGVGTVRRGTTALAIEESRTPAGAGFEQSWRFEHRPAGAGDLEVTVPVEGSFLGADATGLHFSGMRYGQATWVDALGRRTSLRSRFEGGVIRLLVSEATLIGSQYPAVLDPIVGPELSFGPTTLVPESDSFTGGVLAFDGIDYVIFWNESRRIRHGNPYAARIPLDGGITAGIEIDARDVQPQAAEFDGQKLIVAFDDGPLTSIGSLTPPALQPGLLTAVATGNAAHMTRMGSRLLMVYGTSSVSTLVIEADGGISTPDAGPLVPNTNPPCCGPTDLDVAFNGVAANLVVWADGRADTGDIYAQRVDLQGAAIAAPFVISAGTGAQRRAEVSGGGGVFLVTWEDRFTNSVWAVLVTGTGVVQTPRQLGTPASTRHSVTSTFDGTQFIVAWTQEDSECLRAARISTAGVLLEPGVLIDSACFPQGPVEITSDQSGHSLIGYWGRILTLQAKRLTGAQPDDLDPLYFNLAAQSQYATSMASNDTGQTLLGWTTNRYGLQGVVLSLDAGAPVPVTFDSMDDGRDGVSIAGNGPRFWATWSTGSSMVGRFVLGDGGLGPRTTLSTAVGGIGGGSTARDRDGFLTVWSDSRVTPGGIFARRIFSDGGLGPEFEISPAAGPSDKVRAVVAVNSAGVALVVWDYIPGEVRAARVSGEQTLDSPALILRAGKYFSNAAVSSDGRDFLVAWEHDQGGGTLLGTFVPGAGAWDGGDFFLDPPPSSAAHPELHWDGSRYLVAFETEAVDPRTDVWALAVDRDGGVQPLAPIAAGRDTELFGVLSTPGAGARWAAWSAFDPALQSMRVHAQLTSSDPVDAGSADAGVDAGADGGALEPEPLKKGYEVGCGCGSVDSLVGLGALLVWSLIRRTRRRTSN